MAVAVKTSVIDSDAHVEEWAETFSDRYLDPAYAKRRPAVVGSGRRAYWLIDDRLWPAMVGPGCHILGTPTGYGVVKSQLSSDKPEEIDSLELRNPGARIADMDREGLDLQVLYPTLFLAYPLTADVAFYGALCRAYNSWMADATSGAPDRLKWVATTDLGDVGFAVDELKRSNERGAVGVVLLGTQGTELLHQPRFDPFFAQAERLKMPIAVHVGWSCPPFNQLFSELWQSALVPFQMPVLIAFSSFVGGGILDRHPNLKVGFFETGVGWVQYWIERMEHFWQFGQRVPIGYQGSNRPRDYLRSGNLFFTCETDEKLLPQAIELIGEDYVMFASDMPHGDREPFSAREFRQRTDLSDDVKQKILSDNTLRFYDIKRPG